MSKNEKENLLEKLQQDIDRADWDLLADHYKNGAILQLDSELDLAKVGLAMAEDSVEEVTKWLAEKKLFRPDEKVVEQWKNDQSIHFHFLIIQPYVLIKEVRNIQ